MTDARWKARLRPASFRGAQFKIDTSKRVSGRRLAVHEFPKRDDPYAEDMGRKARRFQVTGWTIGPNYMALRDALVRACEQDGPGLLILDRLGEQMVMLETYGVSEVRERGGIAEFDMQFVEAGSAPTYASVTDTQGAVAAAGDQAAASTGEALGASSMSSSPTFIAPTTPDVMPTGAAGLGQGVGWTGPFPQGLS